MDEMAIEPELCVCEPGEIALGFCEEFDAYWCRTCNLWLEGLCSDPECTYCHLRPAAHPLVDKCHRGISSL